MDATIQAWYSTALTSEQRILIIRAISRAVGLVAEEGAAAAAAAAGARGSSAEPMPQARLLRPDGSTAPLSTEQLLRGAGGPVAFDVPPAAEGGPAAPAALQVDFPPWAWRALVRLQGLQALCMLPLP